MADSVKGHRVCHIWMICGFCGPQTTVAGIIASLECTSKNVKIGFFQNIFKRILKFFWCEKFKNSHWIICLSLSLFIWKKMSLHIHFPLYGGIRFGCENACESALENIRLFTLTPIIIITSSVLWKPSWVPCLWWKLSPLHGAWIEMKMQLFLQEGLEEGVRCHTHNPPAGWPLG